MPASSETSKKVAVVTGANRGIGIQIIKNFCEQLDSTYDVLLTSRSEERGQEAVKQVLEAVKNTKPTLKFHQLDIDDLESIERLRTDLQTTYGGLDIFVQNAGVLLRHSSASAVEIAEATMKTNYWAVRDMCRAMLPIVRDNGRIVLLASRLGALSFVKCADTRKRLLSDDLTLEQLDNIMKEYLQAVKLVAAANEKKESKIWNDNAFQQPYGAYAVSKIGVIALGHILQREADALDGAGKNILVTSCCPGYVATDFNDHQGPKTVEQGADTPTYLALLQSDNGTGLAGLPKGQFLAEREVIDWTKPRKLTRALV